MSKMSLNRPNNGKSIKPCRASLAARQLMQKIRFADLMTQIRLSAQTLPIDQTIPIWLKRIAWHRCEPVGKPAAIAEELIATDDTLHLTCEIDVSTGWRVVPNWRLVAIV